MWLNLQMYGGGDYLCRRMHNKSHRLKKQKLEQKSNARGNADGKKGVEREKAIKNFQTNEQ